MEIKRNFIIKTLNDDSFFMFFNKKIKFKFN